MQGTGPTDHLCSRFTYRTFTQKAWSTIVVAGRCRSRKKGRLEPDDARRDMNCLSQRPLHGHRMLRGCAVPQIPYEFEAIVAEKILLRPLQPPTYLHRENKTSTEETGSNVEESKRPSQTNFLNDNCLGPSISTSICLTSALSKTRKSTTCPDGLMMRLSRAVKFVPVPYFVPPRRPGKAGTRPWYRRRKAWEKVPLRHGSINRWTFARTSTYLTFPWSQFL